MTADVLLYALPALLPVLAALAFGLGRLSKQREHEAWVEYINETEANENR